MGEAQRDLKEVARQALELRLAGYPWEVVQGRLGYESEEDARKAVNKGLKAIMAAPAEEVLALDLARLDSILPNLWLEAKRGSLPAIDRLLKVLERRARYLGLDKPVVLQVDWRAEAKAAGLSPEALLETMLEHLLSRPDVITLEPASLTEGEDAVEGPATADLLGSGSRPAEG